MIDRRTLLAGAAVLSVLPVPTLAQTDLPYGTLSNPAASSEAKALYTWLCSQYGRHTLTGQQEQNFSRAGPWQETTYIQQQTGKLPALLGFDYIHPRDNAAVNQRALEWHRAGGIVSICWHWGAPDKGTGYENSKENFDLPRALTPGTRQNRLLLRQMAEVGDLLAELRDQGVPVLWRPFHEFGGDWFWWGKHGPDAFKALWRLMYEEYTRRHGLDNLVWVLGWAGQNVDPAYWPGRETVDIAGADIYVEDHGNLAPMFAQVKAIVGDSVPVCLHENGPIPDPATLGPEADWLWFMTWHTRWLTDPAQNDPDRLREYYNSERYLTRDELPRFPWVARAPV